MARKRMIDPEFWLDEGVAELSSFARLLYIGLWGLCDDNYATFPNRPKWIKAQVFPYDPDESVNIPQLLIELSEKGKIVLFKADDAEQYFFIKNFFKYQRVEKPSKPKYPQFTENRVVLPDSSPNTPAEEKIREEKIREEKNIISGDSRPEENKKPGPLEQTLKEKYNFQAPGKPGPSKVITKEWQEKGFRYADDLSIELSDEDKGRWLLIFKQAHKGRKPANLESAYTYCKDHPNWFEMSNIARMNLFFKIYENGLNVGGFADG